MLKIPLYLSLTKADRGECKQIVDSNTVLQVQGTRCRKQNVNACPAHRIDMARKPAVTRVDEDRHDRWKQQVEESDRFNSLSQALRVGFEQLMDEDTQNVHTSDELIARLDDLEAEIQENRAQIERLPYNYPTLEEISSEVVYQISDMSKRERTDEGRH